jgi:hypothetical protein
VHRLGFTLLLLGRSMRWVAPTIVFLLAWGLVMADPGPLRSSSASLFPVAAVVMCWLTIAIGNVDDEGHRELCTAEAGSPARLLLVRSLSALVPAVVLAVLVTVGLAIVTPSSGGAAADLGAVLVVPLAGGLLGIGIGGLLHRPLVRHLGLTVVGAIGALVLTITTTPATHLLHDVTAGHLAAAYELLAATALLGAALTAAAAGLVGRRTR